MKAIVATALTLILAGCKNNEKVMADRTIDNYAIYVDSLANTAEVDARVNWEAIEAEAEQRTAEANAAVTNVSDQRLEMQYESSQKKLSELFERYKAENADSTESVELADLKALETQLENDMPSTHFKYATGPALERLPQGRSDLWSMKTMVKIYTGDKNAGVSVPGFGGLKLGKNETSVNAYYLERRPVKTSNGEVLYGCGYSVHYLFKRLKRGLSVNNLAAVSASVQLENNKTEVYYSVQSYGISGTPLVKFFKPVINKPFDVEGYGIVQTSIDGIHNILGDEDLSKKLAFHPEEIKFIKEVDFQ